MITSKDIINHIYINYDEKVINYYTYYDDILIKFLSYIRGEFASLCIAVNSRFMTQFTVA